MASSPSKTITLGCRLNAYESERMAGLAAATSASPVVVVNTCAVTSEAVRQSRQAIRRAKKDSPDADIIATGCAVQLDPSGFGAMPEVSQLIGNGEKLSPAAWGNEQSVRDVFEQTSLSKSAAPVGNIDVRAHLEVQNGCDHRCTFCIIPFGRGNARSKAPDLILAEAKELVAKGAKEIVLTGVDLTSYGPDLGDQITLSDAIGTLLEGLPAFVSIRLSSIDGAEVDERLFKLVTGEERIAPHLHLSLQSGDTMILKRMKRRHSREDAVELCQRLKAARPEIVFGADIIAGFPTETEEMFANSVQLIKDCNLSYVHVFPYSPREGTPAARMPQLNRAVIKERAARLRSAADDALHRHLKAKVGTHQKCLIEQMKNDLAFGRMSDFTEVRLPMKAEAGQLIDIEVTGHANGHVEAVPVPPPGGEPHHG